MEEAVTPGDDAPVELRCSTIIFRDGHALLMHRTNRTPDDWVLPGGRPQREPGLEPVFVPLDELPGLRMRPPLAGHLRGLHGRADLPSAPFLGNLWRPEEAGGDSEESP